MILASAASVQLGSDGNAPQNERMTREENDAEIQGEGNPHSSQIRKEFECCAVTLYFLKDTRELLIIPAINEKVC